MFKPSLVQETDTGPVQPKLSTTSVASLRT